MQTRGERLWRYALRDLAQPALHALTGRGFSRHRRFLEESQWWSGERLRELQWRETQRLLRHAWETIPYYRSKWAAVGARPEEVRDWSDFAKIPALTKAEVRANFDGMRSRAVRGEMIPFSTGGSTGEPLHFEISAAGWDWRSAALERAWGWAGATPGTKTLLLWGAPLDRMRVWQRVRERVFRKVRREVLVSTYSQTEALWAEVERKARRFRPRVIAGYAASLEGYLDWLRAKGRRQEGVESAVSAAESAGPRLRQLCQEVLGAPLFETYSAREFFNVASECEAHAGLHVSAENLVVETDEEGELLVTDLRNEGMPLIRYRIGDGGVWAERACGCGRGLPVLARVEGRIYETLQGADGRRVPGEYFGHLFKDCPKVRQYQVAQRGSGMVEVRLVLHEALRDGEREDILRKTRAVFGPGVEVRIEVREELPLLPSGKRQLTVRLRE